MKAVLHFQMHQGDSALTDIHLSDPSERDVDKNTDDEQEEEKVWTLAGVKETVVTSKCWIPPQEKHCDCSAV